MNRSIKLMLEVEIVGKESGEREGPQADADGGELGIQEDEPTETWDITGCSSCC